jgi:SHS2 domain-containing protein
MSPYREVDHTADWALHVWAPTRAALFTEAAQGMYALAGARPAEQMTRPVVRGIELSADDYESLLVAWLQELLYDTESEGSLFSEFRILTLAPTHLRAEVTGFARGQLDKVIKAVTYHNLHIRHTPQGFEVTIVFDV